MNAKIRVDARRIISIENELASELRGVAKGMRTSTSMEVGLVASKLTHSLYIKGTS